MTFIRRATLVAGFVLACAILATAVFMVATPTSASSHREAPLISKDAFADNTDTYVFASPTNPDNLVLAASFIPFEAPEGGPNYWEWDENVTYKIYVDNDGDAVEDYVYSLTSRVELANDGTFLYNVGPITSLNDADWNRRQYVTVEEYEFGSDTIVLVDDQLTAPVNIGSKSTPNYANLADAAIYTNSYGGDEITVFAGQTDDAFWVDLQLFDLLTLRGQAAPIGYSEGNNVPVDSLSGMNVHSLVIELPIDRIKDGEEPVIGVWATAERQSMRVIEDGIAGLGAQTHSGQYVQVSRLGMPLVNEAVLPLALKDAFNGLSPVEDLAVYTDATFGPIMQGAVEDPELGNLLCGLYGVPLPGDSDGDCATEFTVGSPRSGRGDIFDIFLTGMVLENPFTIQTAGGEVTLPAGTNINQPEGVVPAEMIRINTDIVRNPDMFCSPTPSRLGILGGDACGFPNGRRLADDVIEIEMLAVAGAAYEVLDDRDEDFTFNADLIAVLDDGLNGNDVEFKSEFPYFGVAQSGQEHFHINAFYNIVLPVVQTTSSAIQEQAKTNPVQTATWAMFGSTTLLGVPALVWWQRRKEEEEETFLDIE